MLKNQVVDPLFPECPVRNVLARVTAKWAMLVLLTLNEQGKPMRHKEIKQRIPDISQKMLGVTLKNLEADGLLLRMAYAEVPPRVDYSLTPRALSLMPHITGLLDWSLNHFSGIVETRTKFVQGE